MTSHSELDNTPQSSLGADYENDDDWEEEDDYCDGDEDPDDYSRGWDDGWEYAMTHPRWKQGLIRRRAIRGMASRLRFWLYRLRHKIPRSSLDDDIPF